MTGFAILLVFLIGSLTGWLIELLYRTFISQKKLVNPGFLSGPYLPLYGFGTVILFLLSIPDYPIFYRIISFFLVTSILEWVTGEFYLRYFNIRLWDYSNQKLNYRGLVCPLFSAYWTTLALIFYYFAFPYLLTLTLRAPDYVYVYLGIGFFYGIFTEDVVISFHLASRLSTVIKAEVEEKREKWKLRLRDLSMDQRFVDFRLLKFQIRNRGILPGRITRFIRYFNPFNNFLHISKEHINLHQSIKSYMEGKWANGANGEEHGTRK